MMAPLLSSRSCSLPSSLLMTGPPERVGHDLVAVVVLHERHDDDLHLHADGERVEVVGVDAALDPAPALGNST